VRHVYRGGRRLDAPASTPICAPTSPASTSPVTPRNAGAAAAVERGRLAGLAVAVDAAPRGAMARGGASRRARAERFGTRCAADDVAAGLPTACRPRHRVPLRGRDACRDRGGARCRCARVNQLKSWTRCAWAFGPHVQRAVAGWSRAAPAATRAAGIASARPPPARRYARTGAFTTKT
jgi:hypothetical protein